MFFTFVVKIFFMGQSYRKALKKVAFQGFLAFYTEGAKKQNSYS
jgi:hypothetical protein